jgi:putative DNA primase/helicase
MIENISPDMNQPEGREQERSPEIERFAVFRFEYGLGKGIKARIKSLGCSWTTLHHGWICPLEKQDEVKKAIHDASLVCSTQIIDLPKGMIPPNPKIAGKRSRLEILEEQVYKEEQQLLQDVYRYDPTLRPEDFAEMPAEEGKTQYRIRAEKDFHDRWTALRKTKEEVEQARKEITHLEADKGEKIFDPDAPLLIVDALIKEQFLWKNQHRTLHYCSDMFWRWNGMKYIELTEGAMRNRIYEFLRDAKELSDEGGLENFNPTKFKVDQIVDALRAVCHHDHHPSSGAIWLDGREGPDPQYLISFQNGLLNVEDWLENPQVSLMPHTPLLMNVNSLTFDFDPKAGEPQEWLRFLESIWPADPESQETLQEWTGYFLIHDTRLHKILLIIGPPRSGKGTIGRCLMELLGSFNVIGPTLSSLAGEFGLQPFLNKMLALISDARLSSRGNNSVIIERLLSISGEDPLTINRKFLPPLTVQLPTRIMMMSNEIPDMRDSSGALAKRYSVLTLTKSWLGKEDTALLGRLRAELPGILLWALQGLARLQSRGKFIQPASSAQTIEELEAMTSPIKAFVAERCEFKPQAITPVSELFAAWRYWCDSTGYPHSGNVQSFGKNLRAAFPDIETTRPQEDQTRERCYKGIRPIPSLNQSADVRGPNWE